MTDFTPQPISETNRQRLHAISQSFAEKHWPFPVVNGRPYQSGDPVKEKKE